VRSSRLQELSTAWNLVLGSGVVVGFFASVLQIAQVVRQKDFSSVLLAIVVLAAAIVAGIVGKRRRKKQDAEGAAGGAASRGAWEIFALTLSGLSVLLMGAATAIYAYPAAASPPDEGGIRFTTTAEPGPTRSSEVSRSAVPQSDSEPGVTFGAGTLTVDPQSPGECSGYYHVVVDMEDPASSRTLWIVTSLNADPANGLKDTLFYPKTRIDARPGRTELDIAANTTEGIRRNRFFLISANKAADDELQLSYESDRDRDDGRYPDGRRVQLPVGATEIARTDNILQKC
jgi:hypothetical protein